MAELQPYSQFLFFGFMAIRGLIDAYLEVT